MISQFKPSIITGHDFSLKKKIKGRFSEFWGAVVLGQNQITPNRGPYFCGLARATAQITLRATIYHRSTRGNRSTAWPRTRNSNALYAKDAKCGGPRCGGRMLRNHLSLSLSLLRTIRSTHTTIKTRSQPLLLSLLPSFPNRGG